MSNKSRIRLRIDHWICQHELTRDLNKCSFDEGVEIKA